MSFDASDTEHIMRLAHSLLQVNVPSIPDDTIYRTAIGRAYYACFLTARDRLFPGRDGPSRSQQRTFPAVQGSHLRIAAALAANRKLSAGAKGKRLKDQLEALMHARTAADYHKDSDQLVIDVFQNSGGATNWRECAVEQISQALMLHRELMVIPAFEV